MSRAIFDELSQDVRFKITLPIYITSFSPTFQASAISYSIFSTFATTRQLSPQPWFLGPHFFAYTHRINFPQLMFLQVYAKTCLNISELRLLCVVKCSSFHLAFGSDQQHLLIRCPQLIASGPSRGAEEVS